MRRAQDMTIDRALLLQALALAEPCGLLTDVKLQQLVFLCELQMLHQRVKGFRLEFFRFAYGAFSKDLDNDLLSLRKKARIENFTVSEAAHDAIKLVLAAAADSDVNRKVLEIMHAVIGTYGPQDSSALTRAVEQVEVSTPDAPESRIALQHVSFHSTLLVPSRTEVDGEFTVSPAVLDKLNAAMGY